MHNDRMSQTARQRLLFIVHSEYPVGETRVTRQAEAAVRAGWEVDVLALATAGMARCSMVNGVRVFRTTVRRMRRMSAWGLFSEYGRFWLLAALFCQRSHKYDTIVVANPPDFLVFATIAQRIRGARIVLDIHDLMTDLFAVRLDRGSDSLELRALSLVERASLRYADRLMTVHEPYRREVLRRSGGQRAVAVVMNSADPRRFAPRSGPPEGAPVIGYHGSIFERYGVLDLMRAFAVVSERHPTSRLWILGDGDARDDLEALAHSLGVADRCLLSPGFVSAEEVATLLPQMHIGVIPNRPNVLNRYALSTKLFEYVAVGVPVVCVRLETLAAHFAEDELLFFEPESVEDLASKLCLLLERPEEGAERAARAAERYKHQYDWQRNAEVFLRAIQ
jgi:glycosyltransferase involved in cell wall biosynthesis